LTVTDEITKVIEFVRLADMCGVTGMEEIMAEHIKTLLGKQPPTGFSTTDRQGTTVYMNFNQPASSRWTHGLEQNPYG
jgi:hypothetical protein